MKYLVLADIHSNLEALNKVPSGKVLCCGDFVGYGADPNTVIDQVNDPDWTCVLGNHDWAALTQDIQGMNPFAAEAALWTFQHLTSTSRKFLTGLTRSKVLEIEGKKILIVHGRPGDELTGYLYKEEEAKQLLKNLEYDLILVAHTHVPMIVEYKGKMLINPGSVGQPRDGDPRASWMELELPSMKVRLVRREYSVEAAAKKIMNAGLPPVLGERLYQGW